MDIEAALAAATAVDKDLERALDRILLETPPPRTTLASDDDSRCRRTYPRPRPRRPRGWEIVDPLREWRAWSAARASAAAPGGE